MKNNYIVSVVTAVYNDEIGLEKTILSISKQVAKDSIEHIVIDGNSKDNTLDVIKKYSKNIFKWISEKDNGLYYAMNKGLSFAKGDFVFFMNAGDLFDDEYVIDNLLKSVTKLDYFYFGNVILKNGDYTLISKPLNSFEPTNFNSYLPHHQSIFYPKVFYNVERYDTKFKVCADRDFTHSACEKLVGVYIDLNIVISQFGGFGIKQYDNLKGIAFMSNERIKLEEKWNGNINVLTKGLITFSIFLQYLSIVIFGFKGPLLTIKFKNYFYSFLK